MSIPNLFSRKVMILALGLVLTLFTISWLFSGSRTNAQSDGTSQPLSALAAAGTGFTYQGQLNQSGVPANGSFTFQFALYDSVTGGIQIGSTQTKATTVSGGLFTTTLNEAGEFGATAFNGEARYLEIRVSSNGGSSYTTLIPRQPLTAAPLAHSLRPGAVIDSTVDNAAIFNLSNDGTNGTGLSVSSAGIGMHVLSAGTTGMLVESSGASGFYVSDAATNGLRVFSADTGVNINTVTQDGLFVCATGANTTCTPNDSIHSGVEVGNAEHYGLWVTNTGNDGVFIENAGDDGMQIVAAGDDGLDITATDDGVRVRTVGGDGLEVASATDGVHVVSASGAGQDSDGLQVDSATGAGVRVIAANTGLYVQSASNVGVTVGSALNGLYVISATTWDAYFTGDIRVGSTCTGCIIATFVVNAGDNALQPGDVVALQGTRSGERVGQPLLMEVGQAQAGAPVIGVVYGRGELTSMEGPDGQPTAQLAPREGAAQPGDYVHIVTYGPMQVNASALGSAIQMGDKLSVNSSGAARSLQTRMLDGMTITESAPTIGIALESMANKDGLIWVLVNPQ